MIRAAKGNFVDKVVNYFDPIKGATRLRARLTSAAAETYFGASRSRRAVSAWTPPSVDADEATLDALPDLRDRSRDARRNIPLAAGALQTKVTNVIGPGLRVQASIDADALNMSPDQAAEWEAKTEREFRLWSESSDCDVTRTCDFNELQELAFMSCLEGGDTFALQASMPGRGPYRLAIELIEADRCSNPNHKRDTRTLAGGIERNEMGMPTKYWFSKTHPGSLVGGRPSEWVGVPAFGSRTGRRNVLHLYRKLRIGQSRGVPDLAPVIEMLKQLGRYTEAELDAAVVSSFFTVFVQTERGAGLGDVEGDETGATASDDDYKLAPAAILDLMPGESISTATPGRPNDSFDAFVVSVLRQISVAIEMPFEVFIKHFTASYSASRAAIEEAFKTWRTRRKWIARRLCQPVYETWLAEAVAIGRISAPGFLTGDPMIRKAYSGAEWIGPPKGQINEKAEMDASDSRVQAGVSTLARECNEITGLDWRTVHRQRVREVRMRREAGIDVSNVATRVINLSDELDEPATNGDESATLTTNTSLRAALLARALQARK